MRKRSGRYAGRTLGARGEHVRPDSYTAAYTAAWTIRRRPPGHRRSSDIEAAARRIAGRVARTPLLHSRDRGAGDRRRTRRPARGAGTPGPTGWRPGAGCRCGPHVPQVRAPPGHRLVQVAGRGQSGAARDRRGAQRGIVTMSAGNHAAAVAYAAAAAGIAATVVMPVGASRVKAEAAPAYGATRGAVRCARGRDVPATGGAAGASAGSVFVPPFDDPESSRARAPPGSRSSPTCRTWTSSSRASAGAACSSGVAAAVKQARPDIRVYGVEPDGSDAMTQGLAAGPPVNVQPRSIADGLGAPFAGAWTSTWPVAMSTSRAARRGCRHRAWACGSRSSA